MGGLECWEAGEVGEGKGGACSVSEGKGPDREVGEKGREEV